MHDESDIRIVLFFILNILIVSSFFNYRFSIDQLIADVKSLKEKVANIDEQVQTVTDSYKEHMQQFLKVSKIRNIIVTQITDHQYLQNDSKMFVVNCIILEKHHFDVRIILLHDTYLVYKLIYKSQIDFR